MLRLIKRFAILAPAAVLTWGLAQGQGPPQKTLAYFGVGLGDNAFSPQGYDMAADATKAFRVGFEANAAFKVHPFSRSHPSIKRALGEGSLRSALLLPPFTGQSEGQYKALILGKLMRAALAFAGVIETYEFDAAAKSARVVGAFELFDVAAGKLLGTVVLSATGSGETDAAAASAAVAKLAETALPQAVGVLTAPPKKEEPPPH